VSDEEKEEATEKFKVLAKIHEVLSDDNKRKIYDEQGIVDDDEDDNKISTWLEAFKHLFKPISESDINNYHKEYVGSELERSDIKKAYVNGKGCINYMMEHVPFMTVEDEPRFNEIITKWIEDGEVPSFTAYTNEPRSKRERRHKKYARESKEAEEIKAKMTQTQNDENDLAKQIMKRNQDRAKTFDSFLDKLAEKYGNGDEEDELYEEAGKKYAKKNSKKAGGSGSSKTTKKETPIKNGRVEKKKKK
jgi:DnaJ family protein C protein 9